MQIIIIIILLLILLKLHLMSDQNDQIQADVTAIKTGVANANAKIADLSAQLGNAGNGLTADETAALKGELDGIVTDLSAIAPPATGN